jgi:DNA-binding MarR family transcriptional regulator
MSGSEATTTSLDNDCLNRNIAAMASPVTAHLSVDADLDRAGPTHTVHALRTAAAHVEHALERVLEPFGVTNAQYELLHVIARFGTSGRGCSELGRHLAAPGPDVTRMLDRLDTGALVSRRRDPKDRRVVHTELTAKGHALLADATPAVRAAERSVFAGLTDHQRTQLADLLREVRQNCPGN